VIDGVDLRVLIGSAFGLTSPVKAVSPTLYINLNFPSETSAAVTIPNTAQERALYSTDEAFELDGQSVPAHTMVVLEAGSEPVLRATRAAHIVLIGGAPLGHRFMVWNFVSSSKERIVAAQDDWAAQRFERVPGETEFIPLPAR
jgi:redox-sensitive bicupin YhaK (pirin superfamily)